MLRVFLPAAAALLATSAGLSWRLDQYHRAEGTARYPVPRTDVMQAIATDFENLLADAFWIQFLQYNGQKLTEDADTRVYEHLWEGLTLITGLDPRFRDAYVFGSWVLGDAGEADRAAGLIRRGWERNPDDPWFPYQLGFVEFLYRRDVHAGAQAFDAAGERFARPPENARMRLKAAKMAAYLRERGDRKDLAIHTWLEIRRTSRRIGDQRMAGIAERALARLGVTRLPPE